jgi:hypothetical protein
MEALFGGGEDPSYAGRVDKYLEDVGGVDYQVRVDKYDWDDGPSPDSSESESDCDSDALLPLETDSLADSGDGDDSDGDSNSNSDGAIGGAAGDDQPFSQAQADFVGSLALALGGGRAKLSMDNRALRFGDSYRRRIAEYLGSEAAAKSGGRSRDERRSMKEYNRVLSTYLQVGARGGPPAGGLGELLAPDGDAPAPAGDSAGDDAGASFSELLAEGDDADEGALGALLVDGGC